MAGQTHGNRSAVTCHLKCDSACAAPVPNQSTEPSFRDIAATALSRRSVLLGGGAVAASAAVPLSFAGAVPAAAKDKNNGKAKGKAKKVAGGLAFTPIEAVDAAEDAFTVPEEYEWTAILRWGDPLFDDSPRFDPENPSAEAQEKQFGYNNDYLDILVDDEDGTHALLCCNHEYTNRAIMFPPDADPEEVTRTLMAAHGFAVVELERKRAGRPWRYIQGAPKNRRITASTPFELTGAAAGSEWMVTADDPEGRTVLGTLGNCAGGTTPWGTILSGEENFNGYFKADPDARGAARYGLNDRDSVYGFESVDPRFDATGDDYRNEPYRFGYIVEIDPSDPTSTPRKHTAMGRFKHEGANVRVDEDGTVAAYMGDDERFDYLYKFVSSRKFMAGDSAEAKANNMLLLTEGDLYVARFSGRQRPDNDNLGRGMWVPLVKDGRSRVPQMSVEEVLVFTREAADKMRATPMDRCEDVEPSLKTGKVYVACTNNTNRGTGSNPDADAANPRNQNKEGHVIELTESGNKAGATSFDWNILLVCGMPDQAGTYFAGWDGPVAPISCPDNVAFDSEGTLWISTDGQPGTIGLADALHRVPLEGEERGHVTQFLAVPNQAETCGPVIHDQDGSVFVAVQHPGEDGSWEEQNSFFPDYVPAQQRPRRGEWRGPRPSVVQVTKIR
ncbi:PhoX family protein [Desertihabitans aurantiacus]|uniref:PhoX family protein n=1 Tax=Desertihabitans aurantiacus TaxID=2282477 RepID=UPI000DF7FFA0|nr:PhoX family phosphatase [Desertihabitans aurantiacus]